MASITLRGKNSWQAKVRRLGNPPLSKSFATKTAAEAWARKMESDQERGTWRDTREEDRTTFLECLDRYELEVTPRKRSAVREASHLRIIRDLSLTPRPMGRIRGFDIALVRDQWLKVGHAPATIVRRLALVSHIFSTARKEWGMESLENPCRAVTAPVVRNARERRINDLELAAICESCRTTQLTTMIRFAMETGMRRGELCTLQWENVNLRDQVALLELTKNGDARSVPLSTRAIALLRDLPRQLDGRVFTLRPDSVTQAFERVVVRARKAYLEACNQEGSKPHPKFLSNLRFHDLRHEATSRLAERLQMHELSAVTGHRDLRMLKRYYHPRAADLAKKLG
jgi:integrase